MRVLDSVDFFGCGKGWVGIEGGVGEGDFGEDDDDFDEIVIVEDGRGIDVFNGEGYRMRGGRVCLVGDDDGDVYEDRDNVCVSNVV